MSAIREALGTADEYRYEDDLIAAALAELETMERVVEAARVIPDLLKTAGAWTPEGEAATRALVKAEDDLRAALAELDGQHSNAAVTKRESSPCPCRVHGDPDGDCGGGLIYQPTRREMGVDAPDFGPIMGCCGDPGDCGENCG